MRSFCLVIFGLLFLSSLAAADEHAAMALPVIANEPLELKAVLHEIQSANQQLQAARMRWEATKERLPQAAAWEDPRVGVDLERSNRRLTSYHDAEWMISQTLPLTGKLSRRKEAASAEIASASAMLRQTEYELERRARTALYQLANAETQMAINLRNQNLMRQVIEVTRAKYEAGRLRQADVLMAETEFVRMEEAHVELLRNYTEGQTALNSLMKRPPQTSLGHAALPEFAPDEVSLDSLQALALAQRPELAAAESRLATAKARVDLAERDRFPDPEFRIEARQFKGSAVYDLREYDTGVFVSLPWANGAKYRAAIREAKKMAEAETHERNALEVETTGKVRDVWQRLQSYRHHVELFRDRLLPLARQTINATRASYETDRATLPELLAAQHTAVEVESLLNEHLMDYFVAQAELKALTGPMQPGATQP